MFLRGRISLLLFVGLALIVALAGCVQTLPPDGPKTPVGRVPTCDLTAQPRPTRIISLETAVPGPTRVPAPIPIPTLSPLSLPETRWTFSAPNAPTVVGYPGTRLINEQMLTDLWETDVLLRWTHASPPGSNWYQVWTAVDEPYFEPGNCADCGMEGVTSAQRFVSDAEGLSYNVRTRGGGGMQSYQVLACNRAGCSESSNEVGAFVIGLVPGTRGR